MGGLGGRGRRGGQGETPADSGNHLKIRGLGLGFRFRGSGGALHPAACKKPCTDKKEREAGMHLHPFPSPFFSSARAT